MGKHSAVPAIIQWTGLEQKTTQKPFDMTTLSLSLPHLPRSTGLAYSDPQSNTAVEAKITHSKLHRAEPGTEPTVANQRWTQRLASNQKHPEERQNSVKESTTAMVRTANEQTLACLGLAPSHATLSSSVFCILSFPNPINMFQLF